MLDSMKKIDALRKVGWSFEVQVWANGFAVEAASPRKGRVYSEYGQASAATLAKALSAALRDAGEE